MIDHDDADDMFDAAFWGSGWIVAVAIILGIIFFVMANNNEKECAQKTCPAGMQVKLIDHGCNCIMKAEEVSK